MFVISASKRTTFQKRLLLAWGQLAIKKWELYSKRVDCRKASSPTVLAAVGWMEALRLVPLNGQTNRSHSPQRAYHHIILWPESNHTG